MPNRQHHLSIYPDIFDLLEAVIQSVRCFIIKDTKEQD